MNDEVRTLAKSVATNSIVAQATERLIIQIIEVCAEHEKAMLDKCEAIARSEDDGTGAEAARRIANAIAALRG